MDREIAHMQEFKIIGQSVDRTITAADALVVSPDRAHIPADCQTLYIACKLSDNSLQKMLQAMPAHSVVVRY